MKLLAIALVWISLGSLSAQNLDKETLQQIFLAMVEKKDMEGHIDEDGDVVFKKGKFTYFINVNPEDETYFQVVLPNIWPIESEFERISVLKACDYATANTKVTKVYMVRDNVWVSAEIYSDDPGNFERHFMRILSSMEVAKDKFAAKMKED